MLYFSRYFCYCVLFCEIDTAKTICRLLRNSYKCVKAQRSNVVEGLSSGGVQLSTSHIFDNKVDKLLPTIADRVSIRIEHQLDDFVEFVQ